MLKSQPNLTTNDQETLLNIDALYEDWRNQTIQEGIAVGRQEGRQAGDRTTLEGMLVVKFCSIDRKLANAIPVLLDCITHKVRGIERHMNYLDLPKLDDAQKPLKSTEAKKQRRFEISSDAYAIFDSPDLSSAMTELNSFE